MIRRRRGSCWRSPLSPGTLTPFELRLAEIGLAADTTAVVFPSVVVTDVLLALYRRLAVELWRFSRACWEYRRRSGGSPHVSPALDAKDAAA